MSAEDCKKMASTLNIDPARLLNWLATYGPTFVSALLELIAAFKSSGGTFMASSPDKLDGLVEKLHAAAAEG